MISKRPPDHLVIATRGSQLALWQANHVATLLQSIGYTTSLNIIKTTGDRVQDRFLHEIGGKGLFIKELEEALMKGEADVAMHSLKDMPAKTAPEFALPAILPRHSPNDALVVAKRHQSVIQSTDAELMDWLRSQSLTIATSSLRRHAILKTINPSLNVIPIRGNVDTRLRKLDENQGWDGLILAEASLDRLNLKRDWPSISLNPDWFLPSPSQGALAIETLASHSAVPNIRGLNCPITSLMVGIERGILSALGGDCTMPFAGFARRAGGELRIDAQVFGSTKMASASAKLTYSQDETRIGEWVLHILHRMRDNGLATVMKELNLPMPIFD